MKTMIISAASAAAFAALLGVSSPAAAQPAAPKPVAEKCKWQSSPQIGPRTPLRGPVCKTASDRLKEMKGVGGPECDPAYTGTTGRYVWLPRRQPVGPRAPLLPPVRVWVEAC